MMIPLPNRESHTLSNTENIIGQRAIMIIEKPNPVVVWIIAARKVDTNINNTSIIAL